MEREEKAAKQGLNIKQWEELGVNPKGEFWRQRRSHLSRPNQRTRELDYLPSCIFQHTGQKLPPGQYIFPGTSGLGRAQVKQAPAAWSHIADKKPQELADGTNITPGFSVSQVPSATSIFIYLFQLSSPVFIAVINTC